MGNCSVPGEDRPNSEANFQIPFDLFVSKKQKKRLGSSRSYIRFADSFGNLVFKVERPPNNKDKSTKASHHTIKLVIDASGKTLISIHKVKVSSFWGSRFS